MLKKANKAFTLVEIIVVVLVIGIVSAIVLPNMNIPEVEKPLVEFTKVGDNMYAAKPNYDPTNGTEEIIKIVETNYDKIPVYMGDFIMFGEKIDD